VTFITKKTVIKTRTKPNIMHKIFLKKENKCSTKNQKKKFSTKKPTNKKNKCFTKKTNKIYYSTKKPANKKQILKNQQTKKKLNKTKTLKG
jgi:hypothetical protein